MIKKVVHRHSLENSSTIQNDRLYWLSKSPEERVATVDFLRKQIHGNTIRLQRFAQVIQRT